LRLVRIFRNFWLDDLENSGNRDVLEQDTLKKSHFDVNCMPSANSE
jgi:hypothetical protein